MPHVIGCITEAHDPRLVALALVICAIGALTTLQMLARARAGHGVLKWAWVATGGVAFGCGVWVTHFVAMLAYQPNIPMQFGLGITALSLLAAVVGGCLALAVAVAPGPCAAPAGGLILGATIGAMHFSGMAAVRVPGMLRFDGVEVVEACAAGLAFAPLALWRFGKGRLVEAVLLLVLAVTGLHFTAMAAISIRPDSSIVDGIAKTVLAISVGAVGLVLLLASLGTALVDKHLEGRAARDAARFRRFADATFEGLFFLDRGVVSDVNTRICEMLRRAPGELIGAALLSFVAAESRDAVEGLLRVPKAGAEAVLIDGAGDRVDVDVLVRSLAPDDNSRKVVAVRDATERKRAQRRIQELTQIDPVTGLSNRRQLADRLDQCLRAAGRSDGSVAVLCLDLDRFKAVNDFMGYQAGDNLLIEVANRLRGAARESDAVARVGGDEFILARSFTGDQDAIQAFACRLVHVLSAPYMIDGNKVEISASIGIALYPSGATTAETLLHQADLALDRAKQDGRRCHRFFEHAMETKLREYRTMEHDLRQALTNGELYLDYQPVFDGGGLQLAGYEALVRWRHPRLGAVSPAVFIPIAEECGAILPLGRWVLETACAEAASWSEPLGISVNLSPAQFNNLDLPDEIADILARTGLAATRLELEVTEGVLIGDTDRAHAVLSAIQAQGVRIALDDFGTGYASLSYLRRFRFNRLKIDRSFVKEIGVDPDGEAIVRAIMAMSKRLRLEVTAEGVETDQQLALLRLLRCDHLQGFLLGRPGQVLGHARSRELAIAAA